MSASIRALFAIAILLAAVCLANGQHHAPSARRLMEPPIPSAGVAANSYDFLIPNLITAFSSTANQNTYVTSSFTATNGALLIAGVDLTYSTGTPQAPTNFVWNGHTWYRMLSTNWNKLSSPSNNFSMWRTICTNTSANVAMATNTAGSPQGCKIAVFQVLNADDTDPLGSNAVIQVVATAGDNTANPSIGYTQPAKTGTNMLVLIQFDTVNATTGRTPHSTNQFQMVSQALNHATPANGGGMFFSEACLAGFAAATNYCTARFWALGLLEVQPKFFRGGTNYASFLYHGAGTNVIGTTLTRASSTNAAAGKYEQFDFFFSKNVANSETATNWFHRAQANPLLIPVRIGNYGSSNTIRLTNEPSQAFALRASNEFTYMQVGRASPANQVILRTEFDVYIGATNNSALGQVLYDLDRSDGNVTGDFVVFQLDCGAFASGQSNRVNLETNPGGTTTHSTYIAVKTNSTIHVLKQDNRLTGICRATVWDRATKTLLGDITSTQSHIGTFAEGSRDTDISPEKIGNAESGNSGLGDLSFENFMVDDDTGRYSTNYISSPTSGP